MCQLMGELTIQILATVIGGLVLAFLFFVSREWIFPYPQFCGAWTSELTTHSSSYRPYDNMKVTYIVLLAQEGAHLSGTGEKVEDQTAEGTHRYVGRHRVRIEISGYVTKRYLGTDEVTFHVTEFGKQRTSSTVHMLKPKSHDRLSGRFISTIADSTGEVHWVRGSREFKFAKTK